MTKSRLLLMMKKKKTIIKTLDSFPFEAVKPFYSLFKKPIKNHTKTVLQYSTILNDLEITDNDDPIENKYHKMITIFTLIYH